MKISRLSAKRDFDRLFKIGRSERSRYFRLIVLPNQHPTVRLAIIIKSSLIPKATKRNYWRRRIREVMRPRVSAMNRGGDLAILLAAVPAARYSYQELSAELGKLLTDLRIN